MLRLVFYTKEVRLRVRSAFPEDDFSRPCVWKDKLEFIIADSSDYTMVWTSLLPDLEPEFAHALVELVAARYPVSFDYQTLYQECPAITFKDLNDEWVFFGGSFNPWHQGHQACLNLLPEDKILFIVPDRNPQKELRQIHPVLTILEISSRARLKSRHYLVPSFLLEHRKNPTVDWVTKLKIDFPTQKISLLMGFDSFQNIKNWIRPQELVSQLHTIYVVSRLESDEDRRHALDEAHALNFHLNIVFLGKHEFENVSSSEIRNKLKSF